MPTIKGFIKCDDCPNEARYINTQGQWHCSLCDVSSKSPSVRLSDIPKLILTAAFDDPPVIVNLINLKAGRTSKRGSPSK